MTSIFNADRMVNLTVPNVTTATGLNSDDAARVNQLISVWRAHARRNQIRRAFFSGRNVLKDFGISVPRSIAANSACAVGWAAKAVTALSDLIVFDGVDTGDDDPRNIQPLANQLTQTLAIDTATQSALTFGVAFLVLTADDHGRPRVIPRGADLSAAIWNGETSSLDSVLTINDANEHGVVTSMTALLPGKTIELALMPQSGWVAATAPTGWPEPLAVPLISDPSLDHPLGRSRITNVIMAATDMAFRTLTRMEANAEFFSAPKLWFLGASRDAFDGDAWSNVVSAINGIGADEETGEKPTLQQVQQASMTPHSEMLKTIAMMVASDADLPVDSLGITLSNPTSAEAMAAAERRLTRRADRQERLFGAQIEKLLTMAVCLRDGLSEPPADLRVKTRWLPTREISDAARADAFTKIASVQPTFAESTVGLRRLGLNSDEVQTLKSDIAASKGDDLLDRLTAGFSTDGQSSGDGGEQ